MELESAVVIFKDSAIFFLRLLPYLHCRSLCRGSLRGRSEPTQRDPLVETPWNTGLHDGQPSWYRDPSLIVQYGRGDDPTPDRGSAVGTHDVLANFLSPE